ncbi:MAG: carboxymuconolactone decarboxylase family protein [Myxococcota bacterium]
MTESPRSPRIAHLEAPFEPSVQQALEMMMPMDRGVEPLRLFRTIARDLPLGAAMGAIGRFVLSKRSSGGAAFDLRTRELVINRVTARCDCEYEWGVHVAGFAAKAGLTADQIYSTVHGGSHDGCWSPKDAAVIEMVDALHDTGRVPDSVWDALSAHFDEDALLELLVLAGWYHAISFLANGAGTELEPWAARFPERG